MKALRAFVVEDSPVIRENLVATLEEVASLCVIGTAEDEEGALRFLTNPSSQCDIAIVDIFLAHGSGLGVLRGLRESGSKVERVVLTNYATEDIRRHCLELGATRVFDKSAEIDALVNHCLSRAADA